MGDKVAAMTIIGITGAIGHGKSALAEAFLTVEPRSQHLESFYLIAEVVNELIKYLNKVPSATDLASINDWLSRLPDILQTITHLDQKPEPIILNAHTIAANQIEYQKLFAQLDIFRSQTGLLKQKLTEANKSTYRPLLQWIGGYVTTRIDARAWYRELVRRAVRAGEKGTALAVIGGLRFPNDAAVIHEAGGKVVEIQRPVAPQADLQDPTERERAAIQTDCTVINDGSQMQLQSVAGAILADLLTNQLKPQYRASLL